MLVNPISFRLSISFFWNSTWSLYKNNNYKYLFGSDLVFFEFFMFFFRKAMNFRSLDYYPSHIRLYRLHDKTIVNLYYHMSKSDHYFDELDLIYRGSQEDVIIKKKVLRPKLNNNKKNDQSLAILYEKSNFFYYIQNSVKFINKNLIKIIFFKFLWLKKNNFDLKTNLQLTLNLKWNLIKKCLKKHLNISIRYKNNNWEYLKKYFKKIFLNIGKNYIYFFVKHQDLILNLKSKKINRFKWFIQHNDKIVSKFDKIKPKLYKLFLRSFNLKLKSKNNLHTKKMSIIYHGSYENFYKRYKLDNPNIIKNLLYNNYAKKLMNIFWVPKFEKDKILNNKNNFNITGLKQKKIYNCFKDLQKLCKSEYQLVAELNKKLSSKIGLKKKNNAFFGNLSSKNVKSKNIKLKSKNKNFVEKFSKVENVKNKNFMEKFSKVENVVKDVKNVFSKLKSYKKIDKIRAKIIKMQHTVDKKNVVNKNNFDFLYKLNFLKFTYNQKFWIFNMYYYFISKFFKKMSKKIFFQFLKKIELNIFKINIHAIRADIVSKYISSSFKHNYSIFETMRPILVDLKERMRRKRVGGFKITVSGRFKRAQRATFWWRKDGDLLTATQTDFVDYSSSLHKTKYGVCSVSVWLAPGVRGLGSVIHEFPSFNPFFFISKKNKLFNFNYFLLKRNDLFFLNIRKNFQKLSYDLEKNYLKGFITYLLYKYLYLNIFLKNILLKSGDRIHKILQRIILPQYCVYKISLENYLEKNYIKIIPFIHIKLLKRVNLRNSYKISLLNKSKLVHLDSFKYKIFF